MKNKGSSKKSVFKDLFLIYGRVGEGQTQSSKLVSEILNISLINSNHASYDGTCVCVVRPPTRTSKVNQW